MKLSTQGYSDDGRIALVFAPASINVSYRTHSDLYSHLFKFVDKSLHFRFIPNTSEKVSDYSVCIPCQSTPIPSLYSVLAGEQALEALIVC